MSCCQGFETIFDQKLAGKELKNYRTKGLNKTTRLLIDALRSQGVEGKTLLDIGGGIGVIQHELLKAGVRHSINVEASTAYIEATREEAARQGYENRIKHHHGDFVDLAHDLPQSDIVTLDKVICCYPDWQGLVGQSMSLARKFYGVVVPRANWFSKLVTALDNLVLRARSNPFRSYVHPIDAIDAMLHNNGLEQRVHQKTLLWHVIVYARVSSQAM